MLIGNLRLYSTGYGTASLSCAYQMYLSKCDNKDYLQMLPDDSEGTKSPPIEDYLI